MADMVSDTTLRSVDHPWTYDRLSAGPTSPYPTLSPYDDFASLRPTNRSPPPAQTSTPRPGTPRPPSSISLREYRQMSKSPPNQAFTREKLPLPQRSHALGIDIPAVPRIAPRPQFARHVTINAPRRLLLSSSPFTQTDRSPVSPLSSPSLASSITTAPSSPDLPYYQQDYASWPLKPSEPIRTKRRFTSIRQAKRLPHHDDPPWEVHAVIQVSDTALIAGSLATGEATEQRQCPPTRREVTAEHEQYPRTKRNTTHILERDLALETNEQLGHQSWPATYVHYRGASFEVINPSDSLLFGKPSIETPAGEIDLLIDDYLNLVEAISIPAREGSDPDMPSSPPSSTNDMTPTRPLFDNFQKARRKILCLSDCQLGDVGLANIEHDDERHAGVDGTFEPNLSRQHDHGESGIDAIIANYDHTTPSNEPDQHYGAHRQSESITEEDHRRQSDASDDAWIELYREARGKISPDFPFHAALAMEEAQTPSRKKPKSSMTLTHGWGYPELQTTDRTYGDTNRLLQLTPKMPSPPDAQSQSSSAASDETIRANLSPSPMPILQRVTASLGTMIHNDFNREPSQALTYDIDRSSYASSYAAPFYNPFVTDGDGRRSIGDEEADWVTDYGSGDATVDSFGRGLSFDSNREDDGQSAYSVEVDGRPSLDYHKALGKNPAVYHGRDRRRRGSYEASTHALQGFIQNSGSKAATELTRVRTSNNYGEPSSISEKSSENSFDLVLRQARRDAETAEAEYPYEIVARNNRTTNAAGLQYSPTTDTFATVRPPTRNPFRERLLRPEITITPPQPIRRSHTNMRDFHIGSWRHKNKPSGLRSMASMSGQTGLRDLNLTSTPTSNIIDVAEHFTPLPIRRAPLRPARHDDPPPITRPRRVTPFTQQRWGVDVEMDNLTQAGRRSSAAMPTLGRRETENIGRAIMMKHCWNPVALIMLFAGAYDSEVTSRTLGRFGSVDRLVKLEALKLALLEITGFVLAASLIAVFVLIFTTYKHVA